MMSYSAAALVVLAIITECLGAQSDRSRHRSGPIRSVPVGADIKRDVDFDCPEEFGYYPHPTDCTLYYVCVFGGALLESCTGGLMYSHELQTCDWPRNVGCDGTSAIRGEELERLSERQPPPPRPSPRRTPPPPPPPAPRAPPPPPPRAQPNPIVTSRGQPKFNRDEYEKQQQLYAEVDDLPPVEEIESDRQQRVYRGQPSTIGQVQKDRDGYGTQVVSSGRNLNSNIIPASISQAGSKIGSFSFGTQIDDRRTATITQAPQTYSEDKSGTLTDSHHDRQLDIETNEINVDLTIKPVLRTKREVVGIGLGANETKSANPQEPQEISKRSDSDKSIEYIEIDEESTEGNDHEPNEADTERGKRQIRYYTKNGQQLTGKSWLIAKPINFLDIQHSGNNPSIQHSRYQTDFNGVNNNNYYNTNRRPYSLDNISYSTANPFLAYQVDNSQSQRPFKASLPDPVNQKLSHNPVNSATIIITKSPPISSLKNNENLFSLTGGFYNNSPNKNIYQSNYQAFSQNPSIARPNDQVSFQDSSLLPSTIVTGKPIPVLTSPHTHNNYKQNPERVKNNDQPQKVSYPVRNENVKQKHAENKPTEEEEYDEDEDNSNEDDGESSEEDEYNNSNHFPEPPYEFKHPSNKYANIENPFADPKFDFDGFLSKLSNGQYSTSRPSNNQNADKRIINRPVEVTTLAPANSGLQTSTLNYKGMSTPRPFTVPNGPGSTITPLENNVKLQQLIQIPQSNHQVYLNQYQQQQQHQSLNQNNYSGAPQQNAGIPLEAVRPKLKPPNFKDDRYLPISYSFARPIDTTIKHNNDQSKLKGENQQIFSITPKPYVQVTSTGAPIIVSSPKQQYAVKTEKIISQQPQLSSTGKPYLVSSIKPHNAYIIVKQSTPNPLTNPLANDQLSTLQQYWRNPPTESFSLQSVTVNPSTKPNIQKLQNFFEHAIRSSQQPPLKIQNVFANIAKDPITTTVRPPLKRRPIPKPSPEMNDYYYDDEDEHYYYEPPVKSKYMPSTEVKPQRPHMAQNYKEYDDSDSYEDSEESVNIKPSQPSYRRPIKLNKPESVTKNHNEVFVATKAPLKELNQNTNGKIPIPVLVEYPTSAPNVLIRPEVSNYDVINHLHRNTTMYIRKPVHQNRPFTMKPPKYLNQTTLRPYTVRHRLAKPTTVKDLSLQTDEKQVTGRVRHQNIVAQMKYTTPRDSHNQETRFTKVKHDDKMNSLEPTESVAPVSYSASPRPKMLYNGSQNYSPDQYDPFYAIYDEDSELYKDTDYVQQYNTASLRPAVQQTYRGTPPPARRPVETYSPRPVLPDDYDDALIQGQISNQNQYPSAVRQSTRGEGNELGYDHNPSSVRTTLYEATPISTTPSTTSTSTTTTTQRSTTALFTEAMTPSRYTPRSSTDESPIPTPDSFSNQNLSDESVLKPKPYSSIINISSLAKPFEKTENLHVLRVTSTTTERLPTPRRSLHLTNNYNKKSVEVVQSIPNRDKKKVLSLTSGFSIRRNTNDTNNSYTLTVLTRPIDEYSKSREANGPDNNRTGQVQSKRYYYDSSSDNTEKSIESKQLQLNDSEYEMSSESSTRRKDARPEITEKYNIPAYVRPPSRIRTSKPNIKSTTQPPTSTTKYYLKTVIKRPAPFSNDYENIDSTENTINTETIIENALHNIRGNETTTSSTNNALIGESSKFEQYDRSRNYEPAVSPYRSLDNLRNSYNTNKKDDLEQDYTTSTTSTTRFTTTTGKEFINSDPKRGTNSRSKPSYYSYRLEDDTVTDQTTEVFSGKVKNVIKAFFDNFVSTPAPLIIEEFSSSSRRPTTTLLPKTEHKVVNIGFQKKTPKYVHEKPLRNNIKRLQIVTEPSVSRYSSPNRDVINLSKKNEDIVKDFSSTTTTMSTMSTVPFILTSPSPSMIVESSTHEIENLPSRDLYQSKFSDFVVYKSNVENSSKFYKIINDEPSTKPSNLDDNRDGDQPKQTVDETTKLSTETEWERPASDVVSEIASTTSTTKSTSISTVKIEPTTTSTTKSISFPTRVSRVNPAIKLAATNPGGGRRSYQSSSKCSSDNSLQANPKCNEIKYQRPTSTRGRGSAHFSTLSGSEAPHPQPASNRGTPPTRSRPTLKPSTAIVTKPTEYVDIYTNPPSRPAPVYPQPTPDKTAAKCRKDVCLLPDCYCGGKDIPGDLPVETVPQIVILTFDDSVNDLNKVLYSDLFEKGRVNPNGCPISATFYVSHEWTDYSQVQNLYSGGHEMASHTISHSFGEQFSQKKWNREVGGQRELLAAYGGVKLEDVRGMRAPFLSVGGNKMFKMLHDSNFTYDSSMPVYENKPPSWPYTLDYKIFHDCMIPPCPTKSYPGVWEVPMVMWQDLNGGRCSMGDACANPPESEGVYKMLLKNFDRHYTTNRAPFGLFYHAAWFTQPHHKEGFIMFLDFINQMQDVWIVTNWQALQWVRDPTPISRISNFQPFQCNYQDRPKKCNNPKVCNLWHKSGVRYMRTCQPCPEVYPWTGKSGIRSSRIDNDNGE